MQWWLVLLTLGSCAVPAGGSTEEMCRALQQGLNRTTQGGGAGATVASKPVVALIYSGQVCRTRVIPTQYEQAIWTSNR